MEAIAWKYLRQLCKRSEAGGCRLALPEELPGWLAEQCRGKAGARQLRRLVQKKIEAPLAAYLLQFSRCPGNVSLRLRDGIITFQTK